MAGVNEDRFYSRYHMTVDAVYGETVPELESQGLIERQNGYIRLTNRGKFLEMRFSNNSYLMSHWSNDESCFGYDQKSNRSWLFDATF